MCEYFISISTSKNKVVNIEIPDIFQTGLSFCDLSWKAFSLETNDLYVPADSTLQLFWLGKEYRHRDCLFEHILKHYTQMEMCFMLREI